jgi:phosphatidylglycerophosphatase A
MTAAHKNTHRAPIRPLNHRTLSLTSLGLGFLRPAPGTWGSLPPPAIAWALMLLGQPASTFIAVLGALFVISCVLCVAFGGYAEARFGRKDAAEVVIDETAGQALTLLLPVLVLMRLPDAAPAAVLGTSLPLWLGAALYAGTGFVLFRVLDILKPWPARSLENLPAGWGVLADDLMAGLYAAGILTALIVVM